MEEETKFVDAESSVGSYGKDKLSFKLIVLQHLQKILGYSSCEFRGGYFEEKAIMNGNATIQVYISDTREVYSNAIDSFYDVLFPHFDKVMKTAGEEKETEVEDCYKEIFESEEYKEKDHDWKKQSYRNEKVKIKRKLFRELCSFLYRKKYLEMGKIED